MASETFHERFEDLKPETRDLHRAISSLMEELEAVDWYQQRVDATKDEALKEILGHNRDEEIEHAMMVLEWIRRRQPTFDEHAKTYLFTKGDITELEAEDTGKSDDAGGSGGGGNSYGENKTARPADGSLGIGSLKI